MTHASPESKSGHDRRTRRMSRNRVSAYDNRKCAHTYTWPCIFWECFPVIHLMLLRKSAGYSRVIIPKALQERPRGSRNFLNDTVCGSI